MASRSSAIIISKDGLCMDCACILGTRMHSMHAHGLCILLLLLGTPKKLKGTRGNASS